MIASLTNLGPRGRIARVIASLIVGAFIVSACGGESPNSGKTSAPGANGPTPGQEVFPIVASSDLAVGENRFLIGLIDDNDAPVRSPETTLRVGFLPPGSDTVESVTEMSFVWSIKPLQGLWVGTAEFSVSGEWRAAIELQGGEYQTTVGTAFQVKEASSTPSIGTRPPAVDTPTAGDVKDLAEITTDSDPDPRFYELSIADALKAKKPAVIVFATPKFCTSQVCGPTLSIVKEVSKDFPEVNFLHVEPYDLDKVPEKLEPIPAVLRWGLPSEPWVFVTDAQGRLAGKYEGAISPAELSSLLRKL